MNQTSATEGKTQKPSRKKYGLVLLLLSTGLVMVVSGSLGFIATSVLLKLPKAEACPKIFWPLASASMRLYCGKLTAETQTVETWIEAIRLVEVLPADHPLRPEVNRLVEEWTLAILNKGEESFQAGDLEAAVAIAKQIPPEIPVYGLVETKVKEWQALWLKGEQSYAQVKQYISTRNWSQAYREAVQLSNLENQYWGTVKYEEALKTIQAAQQESTRLEAVYALVETQEVDKLLEAITEAEKIESSSSAYEEAQKLIEEAKNNLLKIIESQVQEQDWQGLEELLAKIEANKDFQSQIADWRQIAEAGISASQGTVESLEIAMAKAELINAQSPVYFEAQKLIKRWELEIEDVQHLANARQLAQGGTLEDYQKAIAIAENIPRFNPRYEEAQSEINNWDREIAIIEDLPILRQAQKISRGGTVNAWEEAIAQANLIAPNRPLYAEAQKLIQECRYKIESTQDQPYLDQAIALGRQGKWSEAIAKAQIIRSGRALYPQAQAKIRVWQQEVNAESYLEQAYSLAQTPTVANLAQAIRLVSQIPNSTAVADQKQPAINTWSEQLLALAEDTSLTSYKEAIQIANLIPAGTPVYNTARTKIEIWKRKQVTPPILDIPEEEN